MKFTYEAYKELIELLCDNNYKIANYKNYKEFDKSVILRHDIDYSLEKAVALAELENSLGISSVYFVLVTSDFYNIFSKESSKKINRIIELGHEIGLHFDELRYDEDIDVVKTIINEKELLEKITYPNKVESVSMHRPSKKTLESNYKIPEMINSYGNIYFNDFKYLSDSRRRWRENVLEIIKSGTYDKLHILTHAFWYFDKEKDIKVTINKFLDEAKTDRYSILKDNITDLKDILND